MVSVIVGPSSGFLGDVRTLGARRSNGGQPAERGHVTSVLLLGAGAIGLTFYVFYAPMLILVEGIR